MAHALATNRVEELGRPDPTVAFYERNADDYARRTLTSDLTGLYPELLERLPVGALILDAGSGAGRDIQAFTERGFRVEAFDASASLARLATKRTGIDVQVRRFEDWSPPLARYDGCWCFASLLHVARPSLSGVIQKLVTSLKPGGWLFASFKEGDADTTDEAGRRFTNLVEADARDIFKAQGLDVKKVWKEAGPAALGGTTSWIYVLAQQCAS